MARMHNSLLTPEETRNLHPDFFDNPIEMAYDFCTMFDIKECRSMLWKMTVAFLGSEKSDGLTRHERSDYIFFYEMLLALVEAAYLLDAKNQTQKIKGKKKSK